MKYFIEKINENNDYTIKSEVEVLFGNATGEKTRFIGYIAQAKVDWNDEEIREKLSSMNVGDKYEVYI